MSCSDLLGTVAIVTGADAELGADVARTLSALGASVVVTGADERALGRLVGEIAAAAGKARHVVAAPHDVDALRVAAHKAASSFARATVVVACDDAADGAFSALVEEVPAIGKLALAALPVPAELARLIEASRNRASPSRYP